MTRLCSGQWARVPQVQVGRRRLPHCSALRTVVAVVAVVSAVALQDGTPRGELGTWSLHIVFCGCM